MADTRDNFDTVIEMMPAIIPLHSTGVARFSTPEHGG